MKIQKYLWEYVYNNSRDFGIRYLHFLYIHPFFTEFFLVDHLIMWRFCSTTVPRSQLKFRRTTLLCLSTRTLGRDSVILKTLMWQKQNLIPLYAAIQLNEYWWRVSCIRVTWSSCYDPTSRLWNELSSSKILLWNFLKEK